MTAAFHTATILVVSVAALLGEVHAVQITASEYSSDHLVFAAWRDETKTFSESFQVCQTYTVTWNGRNRTGRLARVYTKQDNAQIHRAFPWWDGPIFERQLWLDGNDEATEGTWVRSDGSVIAASTSEHETPVCSGGCPWDAPTNQPNGGTGQNHLGMLRNGTWDDDPQGSRQGFACEFPCSAAADCGCVSGACNATTGRCYCPYLLRNLDGTTSAVTTPEPTTTAAPTTTVATTTTAVPPTTTPAPKGGSSIRPTAAVLMLIAALTLL